MFHAESQAERGLRIEPLLTGEWQGSQDCVGVQNWGTRPAQYVFNETNKYSHWMNRADWHGEFLVLPFHLQPFQQQNRKRSLKGNWDIYFQRNVIQNWRKSWIKEKWFFCYKKPNKVFSMFFPQKRIKLSHSFQWANGRFSNGIAEKIQSRNCFSLSFSWQGKITRKKSAVLLLSKK